MNTASTSLFSRPDTMLGVCEGLGEDFGFNPFWLRVALGVGVLWNPVAVIAAYLALGVGVLASRLLFPKRRAATTATAAVVAAPRAGNDETAMPLDRAA